MTCIQNGYDPYPIWIQSISDMDMTRIWVSRVRVLGSPKFPCSASGPPFFELWVSTWEGAPPMKDMWMSSPAGNLLVMPNPDADGVLAFLLHLLRTQVLL